MATSKEAASDTDADAISEQTSGYDETSGIWLEEFSLLLNYMFPVEYIFHEWYLHQEWNELKMPRNIMPTGSSPEGFCIPSACFIENPGLTPDNEEHWNHDHDLMVMIPCTFQSRITGLDQPIFTVEHVLDDPRYVKLRITREFRCKFPQFVNVEFFNHALMFDYHSGIFHANAIENIKIYALLNSLHKQTECYDSQDMLSREVHGPVYKECKSGLLPYERDYALVFAYPGGWPKKAMEWLVRPAIARPNSWPSPDLIQEIFKSGCHIAAVGRGKRSRDPMDVKEYWKNPEAIVADTNAEIGMDETEWRMSFSVAENKLAASVSPIQRHVMVLLKMLKKMYFSDISTYMLKNLAFWQFERKGGSFWNDDNIAVCLLFMLDQLVKCLEKGFLPHYIMPESNLLEGEDPNLLKKAAETIVKIRRSILQQTISMMKKLCLQTMFCVNKFNFEGILLKIENKSLEDEERLTVKRNICNMLANTYTFITYNLPMSKTYEIETLMIKVIYQSILARLFCKIYHLHYKQRSLDDIVADGTKYLPSIKGIMVQSKEYLHGTFNGTDSSTLVSTSSSMIYVREMQRLVYWSLKLSGRIVFDCRHTLLQVNDYLGIVKYSVENDWNLKRLFRGLEKVRLIVMTMIKIEEIIKGLLEENFEQYRRELNKYS